MTPRPRISDSCAAWSAKAAAVSTKELSERLGLTSPRHSVRGDAPRRTLPPQTPGHLNRAGGKESHEDPWSTDLQR